MKDTYRPEPLDTSDVKLSDALVHLTEQLAKNVHDVWAVDKLKEKWSYGPQLDAEKKTTPCLVPYEELSDAQKKYDRNTAIETIKIIIKLGYTISDQKEEQK